jgi:hypothetical protein
MITYIAIDKRKFEEFFQADSDDKRVFNEQKKKKELKISKIVG